MKLFLIGCIIGIGKVLPGISGSILAIRLGIYEKVMNAILHFSKKPKENLLFLSVLGSGFIFSTIFGSKVLLQLFLKYGTILKILFVLFIITGIPELIKKSNSLKITILGWYEEILTLFSEIYLFQIAKIVPFLLGIGIGGFLLLKLMDFLFSKYSEYMYSAILGFLVSSLFFLF